MKYKVLACKVFMRELYALAWDHPNVIDIHWMRQQLHLEPEMLRRELQRAIDAAEAESETEHFDAILLGYGLCSNGIQGLTARTLPIVVPRAHDCMTVFLGSRARYQRLFEEAGGGAYWYTPGWIEHCNLPSEGMYEALHSEYVERFGEDNAEYLVDLEKSWMKEYRMGIYVGRADGRWRPYRDFAKECADYFHWEFREAPSDDALLARLLGGQWDESDFLVVQPGQRIRASHTESIVEV